jgi:septal ring factor EnvC (AmiA/AmiB activator)
MSNEQKPREFYIKSFGEYWESTGIPKERYSEHELRNTIHVIEYSAYEAMCKERSELEHANGKLRAELEAEKAKFEKHIGAECESEIEKLRSDLALATEALNRIEVRVETSSFTEEALRDNRNAIRVIVTEVLAKIRAGNK